MQKLLKMKGRETMKGTSCEECAYFEYDEDEESYGCQFFFDEDDIAKASLYGDRYICPQKKAANKTFVYGVCDLWRAKKLQQWGRVQKKIPLI